MKKKRINYFKYFSLFFTIILLMLIAGCNGASPTAPIINSFLANPTTITVGESSALSWSVTDATSVTVDNGIGSVALTGTTAVNPTTTTTYMLTATNVAGSVTATTTVAVSSYVLGDIGPAGGYIFYDKGSYSGSPSWRYLEAAPSDQSTSQAWSNIINVEIGTSAQGTAIGTGQTNTTAIIGQTGHTASAAQLCNDLTEGGYNDWFLPSKDELNLMYENLYLFAVGGFAVNGYYWSSSESYVSSAWVQFFYDGGQGNHGKEKSRRVRAVRAF